MASVVVIGRPVLPSVVSQLFRRGAVHVMEKPSVLPLIRKAMKRLSAVSEAEAVCPKPGSICADCSPEIQERCRRV